MARVFPALGVLLLPIHVLAAPVAAPHVVVDLVSEVADVAAGHPVTLGIRFVLEDGWHVYWRNPGDSGEAPTVTWTLPSGFTAEALEWPAPVRIPVGPLANFGYEGSTLLPVTVRVPSDLRDQASVEFHARIRWLVCNEEECIPGSAELSRVLPVTAMPHPSADAPLFATARTRLPVLPPPTWRLRATREAEAFVLDVGGGALDSGDVLFFPYDRQIVEPAAPQRLERVRGGFRLAIPWWRTGQAKAATLAGVLTVGERAYAIDVPIGVPGFSLRPVALAFAGGLLLNLMPCVFPVLALKAFGLVGLAREERSRVRQHGFLYTLGVLVSFWVLAAVLLVVRAGGTPIGWGFQLQSPAVVALLASLFFWMGLVLLGVSSFGGSFVGAGNRLTSGEGARAAFFTGVLATVVATPCSAPFMGAALGYALVQPAPQALGVFSALGFGLAAPYLALTLVPALGRHLPRPGRWMETLKELLAFPLFGTVAWLVWVAAQQSGPGAVAVILTMLLLLALAVWIHGRWRYPGARALAAAIGIAALGFGVVGVGRDSASVGETGGLSWEPYSTTRLGELRRAGTPVFVDFTAAWCVTCQVNERLTLAAPTVVAKMRERGVVPVRADWTTSDPDITRALQALGRDGVPLYVLYSGRPEDPPRILPQLLTRETVISELDQLETRSRT